MESWRRRWLLEKERFPEHGQDGSEQPSPSTAGTLAFICQSWFCSHGYATWRACYQPFICGNTVEYMMFQIKICGLDRTSLPLFQNWLHHHVTIHPSCPSHQNFPPPSCPSTWHLLPPSCPSTWHLLLPSCQLC